MKHTLQRTIGTPQTMLYANGWHDARHPSTCVLSILL